MPGCRSFHLRISLWLKPSSIMTKNLWTEGSASCCHWGDTNTETCPPPQLFPACPPPSNATETSILCFPLCFPSPSLGSPAPPPPPPVPITITPGPGCSPAGPRGGFSESATVSAESLAARANGRSFFNQLKLHFLQISPLPSAAKKKPAGRQEKKKKKDNQNPTHPPHAGCKVTAQARRVIIYSLPLCKSQK